MTQELLAQIDVEKRTTRGRACPRCGGKIIPSIRAVYQAADPEDSVSLWQCERCGYEEIVGKKAPATKAAPAVSTSSEVAKPKPALKPPMLDAKGRALPPDVMAIVSRMGTSEKEV
jgi:DNA-directed RNA polymerase subunit RPC12/RpoP